MHYSEVISTLKKRSYLRIMVTGPQRSGTTITAKIIAKELDFQYLDEREIQVDNFDKLFKIYQRNKFVLQAPGLCAYAHMMPGAVVLVRRNIAEIVASQERIKWGKKPERRELHKYFEEAGIISEIKYDTWDNWQSDRTNLFEIDYASIADHPMYVEDRKDFKPKQTAN